MKKTSYAEKQAWMRRIFALVLAILMLLGTVAIIIPYVSAADVSQDDSSDIQEMTEDAQNEEEPDNGLLLRIGMMYGSSVTQSFAVRADDGFLFSRVAADDTTLPLFECKESYISVAKDGNLGQSDGIYMTGTSPTVIGGYHLQLSTAYYDPESIGAAVDKINAQLKSANVYSSLVYAFPAYCYGALYVRIGDFGSSTQADSYISAVANAVGKAPTVVYPDSDMMTVIAPDNNLILFEFSSRSATLGADPLISSDSTKKNYISTPANNRYEGTFLFDRYSNGISVTNLIALEPYVAGVIPYEINNKWSYQAIKAFACIVRSFSLANRGKHSTYGIDLCATSNCQVYKGVNSQNDAVLTAVDETRGVVIAYDGKVCNTFYSAVTGGTTVNIEQIWNGTYYPYLRAVSTPWEDYASHPYGEWVKEYSPIDLYNRLKGRLSNFNLVDTIASVTITELAENSDYVYKLTVTDPHGNSYVLKGTDIVRTNLGVNSANLVVGYKGEIPILNKPLSKITASGEKEIELTKTSGKTTTQIMTADGVKEIDVTDGMQVKSGDGTVIKLDHIMKNYDIPDEAKDRLYDKNNNNFIFIGKGWGHGGGISQWGAKNMAEQGASYTQIINAYFTDVTLCDYRTLPQYAKE